MNLRCEKIRKFADDMTDIQNILPDGCGRPAVIAGPCSAETRQQMLATAEALAAEGVKVFRAGIWKPRTHPGDFEGVGGEGLAWLAEVKQRTGMLTATEVATRCHVEEALAAGTDILWIGARTTANPFAVQEVADAIAASGRDVPILVKNPVNPDLELWIGAFQRLYNAGVRRIGAIHRGFSVYGKHLYRNMPQWRIPIELRRRYPALPIFCDPSHIGGRRDLIAPLSQEAMDMGFDGLFVESHINPDAAWSDKNQQVTPEVLAEIVKGLVVREGSDSSENLALLRRQIDEIDGELLDLLERRMRVSREIGRYKKEHGMPVVQIGRHDEIMDRQMKAAEAAGMSADFMRSVLSAIHEESVRQQVEIINK